MLMFTMTYKSGHKSLKTLFKWSFYPTYFFSVNKHLDLPIEDFHFYQKWLILAIFGGGG